MIIDAHTHIFPENIKNSRTSYFNSEKEFELLYKQPGSKLCTAEELIESMDKNEIDKSIVFGFPWNKKETAEFHNDYIIEKYEKYHDRLIPFACFNPVKEYAQKEALRCIRNGFKGLGELALYKSDFTDEILDKITSVMNAAEEKSLPVMFHTNEEAGHDYPGKAPVTIKGTLDFIQRFKSNRLILAHLGGGTLFFNLLKNPPDMKNAVFDTAALPFLYKKSIYKLIENSELEDKIIFGSDWPLINPGRYFREIESNVVSKEFKEKIFYKNISDFLYKNKE
jgi:predicted TIM-barrel fold metal-dependent hydrolase